MRTRDKTSEKLGKEALNAAFVQGDIRAAELAFLTIGFCLINNGKYTEAITESEAMKELVAVRFGTRSNLPAFSIITGVAYRHLGFYDRSVQFVLEAQKLARSAGDNRSLVIALNNLGIVLSDSGEMERAIEQFTEAVTVCASMDDQQLSHTARSNLAYVLGKSGRDEEALVMLEETIKDAKLRNDTYQWGNSLDTKGASLLRLGRLDAAIDALTEAATLLAGTNTVDTLFALHLHLADALTLSHKPEEALTELDKAESAVASGLTAPQRSLFCVAKAKTCETLGRYKESSALYREYVELSSLKVAEQGRVAYKQAELEEQRNRTEGLELDLLRRTERMVRSQEILIAALASLAELRDSETGAHVLRTSRLVALLGAEMVRTGYPGIDERKAALYASTSVLHDIGKVGISDTILLKPGPLLPEEIQIMKEHVTIGERVLGSIPWDIEDAKYAEHALEIVSAHHEQWNGTGYPRGLAGEAIPLGGRIMSVADVYDAIRSKRPYKSEQGHAEAVSFMVSNSGVLFDSRIIDAMVNLDSVITSLYS